MFKKNISAVASAPWKYWDLNRANTLYTVESEEYCDNLKDPQLTYFGFLHHPKEEENDRLAKEFIRKLDREFDFVLVQDRMVESLVVLRRKLRWRFEDLALGVNNVNREKVRNNAKYKIVISG